MTGRQYRARLKWFIAALLVALGAGLVLAFLSGESELLSTGPGTLLGWAVPLAIIFVVIAVSWFILSADPGARDPQNPDFVTCDTCGKSVRREWRLCPFCGTRLAGSPDADGSSGRA